MHGYYYSLCQFHFTLSPALSAGEFGVISRINTPPSIAGLALTLKINASLCYCSWKSIAIFNRLALKFYLIDHKKFSCFILNFTCKAMSLKIPSIDLIIVIVIHNYRTIV